VQQCRPLHQRAISMKYLIDWRQRDVKTVVKTSHQLLPMILAATQERDVPFVDTLPPEASGPADIFISYSWANSIFGVMHQVQEWLQKQEDDATIAKMYM